MDQKTHNIKFNETAEWESEEFFEEIAVSDRKEKIRQHIRDMEREGYSRTRIQAELLRIGFAPGLALEGMK